MDYRLAAILDLPVLQTMLDSLWRASGIPLGIVDAEGEMLVSTGWQELCSVYHRKHPEFGDRCFLSRMVAWSQEASQRPDGEPFEFTCASGLVDIGLPIYFDDHYLGTLFLGQFLYEPPDQQKYIEQALRFGFDPDAYLELLAKVPIIPREKVKEFLAFHASLVNLLSETGLRKVREERARRELEESEQTFRSLFANANDGIIITSMAGEVLNANPAICRLLGYSHEELLRLNHVTLSAASAHPRIPERIAEIARVGHVLFETLLLHKDGQPVPVEISACPFQYHGQPALLGNVRDLSDRRQAEQALRASEARFRSIFQSAAIGMATLGADAHFTAVNPALCSFLGYTESELLQLSVPDVTHPDDRKESLRQIALARQGQLRVIDMEKRYLRKDGSSVWGRVTASWSEENGQQPGGAVVLIQDVDERKATEQALQESEERFRSVVNSSPMGILMYRLEPGDRLVFSGYNPAADTILRVDNRRYLGKELLEAFPGLADSELPERFRQVLVTGEPWQCEQFQYRDNEVGGAFEFHAFRTAPNQLAIMFIDITDRIQTTAAIHRSETALKGILMTAPMSIGMVKDRMFSWVNRWMVDELGYSEQELIGRSARMLYESDAEFERVGREKYREVSRGRMGEVQTRWLCRDGRVIDVLLRSMPIDPVDLMAGVIFTALNISELKRASAELQEKEERVRLLLESAGEAISGVDLEGRCIFCNPASLEFLGYADEADLLGRNMHQLIHHTKADGQDYPASDCPIYHAFRNGAGVHVDDEVLWRADGSSFPAEYWCAPIYKDDQIVGSVVNFIDITERRQAEAELKNALAATENAREQINTILRSVADGLIVVDPLGTILLGNPAAEDLLEAAPGTLVGEKVETRLADPQFLAQLSLAMIGEETSPVELKPALGLHADSRMLQCRIATVRAVSGGLFGAVVILRDVTREHEINRLKDDFISTAAHELRTPMTSILGYTEMMLEQLEQLERDRIKEFLEIVQNRSEALARIISDLLDLSRVQSGRLIQLDKSPGDLVALSRRLVNTYQMKSRYHQFHLKVIDSLPLFCFDADKLRQVFDNLLSNAIKFSPDGGDIEIRLEYGDDRVTVSVVDQGIGMTPEQVSHVFDKFYRADSTNTAVSGLGLGMSLVKGIIEGHGGRVEVESQPGRGSLVRFSLPTVETYAE